METAYKILIQQNAIIHAFMGYQPEEEYHVATLDGEAYRFSPKQCGYDWAPQQKMECDKHIAEYKLEGKYKTLKTLNYPFYDRNWNELMPVVEKIESLGHHVAIETGFVEIGDDSCPVSISHEDGDTKIKMAYRAVLEFIDWYNSTQNREMTAKDILRKYDVIMIGENPKSEAAIKEIADKAWEAGVEHGFDPERYCSTEEAKAAFMKLLFPLKEI